MATKKKATPKASSKKGAGKKGAGKKGAGRKGDGKKTRANTGGATVTTPAPAAKPAARRPRRRPPTTRPHAEGSDGVLRGLSDIRRFFRTNTTPIYFVSPTPFNLLGIDRWVRNFYYISYYDTFQATHPRMFVPRHREAREFTSMEDICNYLLTHPDVITWMGSKAPHGKALFVMFDEETETLARAAGLDVAHPPAALRHHLDSKIVTTRLAEEAGVPSVPNVLGRATSYPDLLALADRGGLGRDLVVQMPYGDSGKTTFFITSKKDWDRCARKDPLHEQELKVMKRISHLSVAVEAVVTRHGTIVGPLMNDVTGHPELTPYRGGWAGNDYPADINAEQRLTARSMAARLGDRLAEEGYRGLLEIDFLVDLVDGEVYLGEINPRISGISSVTNVTVGAYADAPLFLFHLLEYMDVEYELDVAEINDRWAADTGEQWGQVIFKETREGLELLTSTPVSGIYAMDSGGHVTYRRMEHDWHDLTVDEEAFYLRIMEPGDVQYKGADLGALVLRLRLQSPDGCDLYDRCTSWIEAMRAHFMGIPLAAELPPPPPGPLAFKMS